MEPLRVEGEEIHLERGAVPSDDEWKVMLILLSCIVPANPSMSAPRHQSPRHSTFGRVLQSRSASSSQTIVVTLVIIVSNNSSS